MVDLVNGQVGVVVALGMRVHCAIAFVFGFGSLLRPRISHPTG